MRGNPSESRVWGWCHTTPQVRGACGIFSVCKWGEGPAAIHKVAFLFEHARSRSQSESSPRVHVGTCCQACELPLRLCSVYSSAARGSATRSGSHAGKPSVQFGLESGGSGGVACRHRRTTRHSWDGANAGGRRTVGWVRWGWQLRRTRRAGSRSRDGHRRRNGSTVEVGEGL